MTEYDKLLTEKENNLNNPTSSSTQSNFTQTEINKNKEECYNDMDNFFKYIFKNINVENLNDPNLNQDTNNSNNNPNNSNMNFNKSNSNNPNNLNNLKNKNTNNSKDNKNKNNNKNNNPNSNLDNNLDNNIDNNINNNENKQNKKDEIDEIEEDDEDENERIISDFIKMVYKKIVLKCHPDKGGDRNNFIKCKEYYDNKFLIGLLYIGFIVKYELPELNKLIINKILFEIRVIQEKIIALKLELKRK